MFIVKAEVKKSLTEYKNHSFSKVINIGYFRDISEENFIMVSKNRSSDGRTSHKIVLRNYGRLYESRYTGCLVCLLNSVLGLS